MSGFEKKNYTNPQGTYFQMPSSTTDLDRRAPDFPKRISEVEPCEDPKGYKGLYELKFDDVTDDSGTLYLFPYENVPSGDYDSLTDRALAGLGYTTYGLEYETVRTNDNPSGKDRFGLCRNGDAKKLYAYESHPILTNYCTEGNAVTTHPIHPLLRSLPASDITKLVGDLTGHKPDNHSKLFCVTKPDKGYRRGLGLESPSLANLAQYGPWIIAMPEGPLKAGLQAFIKPVVDQANATDNQKKMADEQGDRIEDQTNKSLLISVLLSIGTVLLLSPEMRKGTLNTIKGWIRKIKGEGTVNVPTVEEVSSDLTGKARAGEFRHVVDETTPKVADAVEKRMSAKRGANSAVVTAPPGWGKEKLMQELALRNPGTFFFQTSPDAIMAGTMYRGDLEKRVTNIPKEIEATLRAGKKVVLCMDEFQEAAFAGKNMEDTRTLLERWKGFLATGHLTIVGFSTPDEWLKVKYMAGLVEKADLLAKLQSTTDPAEKEKIAHQISLIEQFERDPSTRKNINLKPLLARFQEVDAPARPAEDIIAMLHDEVEIRSETDRVKIEFDRDALDLIARASESPKEWEGHVPRDAFNIFNGVLAEKMEQANGKVHVTKADTEDYIKASWKEIAQRIGLAARPTPPPLGGTDGPGTGPAIPDRFSEVEKLFASRLGDQWTSAPEEFRKQVVKDYSVSHQLAEEMKGESLPLEETFERYLRLHFQPSGASSEKGGEVKEAASVNKEEVAAEARKVMLEIYRTNESLLGQESTVMSLVEQARMSYDPASGKTLAEWAVRYVDMHFIAQERAGRAVDAKIKEGREKRGISEKDFEQNEWERVVRMVESAAPHGVRK